jgi:bifunctional N-acetylglucosamine-1-phosphate-uridyltransferase/glucosamine-1-phosphate-acetyltransferase GlmU-like protein
MRAIEVLMLRNIQTKGEYFLTDALQLMVENGARFTAPTRSFSTYHRWEELKGGFKKYGF